MITLMIQPLRRTLLLKVILLNFILTAKTFIWLCAALMHVALYNKIFVSYRFAEVALLPAVFSLSNKTNIFP